MRTLLVLLAVLVPLTLGASLSNAEGHARSAFGFNASLSGFPTGSARLTGGGSYDPASASNTVGDETTVKSSGGFRCTSDVAQGPLSGCLEGEGVRWETVQLLASTTFKCNGSADSAHTVTTDNDTIVILADFYRAGDGIDESFGNVPMFVSDQDERPDLPGDQNVWIAGVGCGDGVVNFN